MSFFRRFENKPLDGGRVGEGEPSPDEGDVAYAIALLEEHIRLSGRPWPPEVVDAVARRFAASRPGPRSAWPRLVRQMVEAVTRRGIAGDAIEDASHSFDEARPRLRMALLPRELVPTTDVTVPSSLEGLVEVLALDAGRSISHSWNHVVLRNRDGRFLLPGDRLQWTI